MTNFSSIFFGCLSLLSTKGTLREFQLRASAAETQTQKLEGQLHSLRQEHSALTHAKVANETTLYDLKIHAAQLEQQLHGCKENATQQVFMVAERA